MKIPVNNDYGETRTVERCPVCHEATRVVTVATTNQAVLPVGETTAVPCRCRPLTPERLAGIKADLDWDPTKQPRIADYADELLAEVERLRAELARIGPNDRIHASTWREEAERLSDLEIRQRQRAEKAEKEVEWLRAALLAQRDAYCRWLEAEAAHWVGDYEGVAPEVSAAVWKALTGAAAYFRGDAAGGTDLRAVEGLLAEVERLRKELAQEKAEVQRLTDALDGKY